MDNTQLTEFIQTLDPAYDVKIGKQYVEVDLPPDKVRKISETLRSADETWFDYLICLSGVDYGQDLGVVYHLGSSRYPHKLVLRTKTSDRENPVLETVSDIWRTADFHEREVFDLLGIKFNNHPDLRRLFLTSSWGFPLRKDYKDDVNIVTK